MDALIARWDQWNDLWLNDGGTFSHSDQQTGSSRRRAVALGDLDAEGHLDAFVANEGNQANIVWLNRPISFIYLPLVLRSGSISEFWSH